VNTIDIVEIHQEIYKIYLIHYPSVDLNLYKKKQNNFVGLFKLILLIDDSVITVDIYLELRSRHESSVAILNENDDERSFFLVTKY